MKVLNKYNSEFNYKFLYSSGPLLVSNNLRSLLKALLPKQAHNWYIFAVDDIYFVYVAQAKLCTRNLPSFSILSKSSIGKKIRGWLLEIRRHLTISHDSSTETFRDFIKLISLRRPSNCGLHSGLRGIQFVGRWIYSNFPELKSRDPWVATSTATKTETLPHKSISISFVRRNVSWPPSQFWRN